VTAILSRYSVTAFRRKEVFLRKPLMRCHYVPPREATHPLPTLSDECMSDLPGACSGRFEWNGLELPCDCDCHFINGHTGKPAYDHPGMWD
jgi:hypothetical protein